MRPRPLLENEMIDVEKISKEHAELFPMADAESQLVKLEEEIRELIAGRHDPEQVIKELADILIVCCGLNRWHPLVATVIINFYMINCEKQGIDYNLIFKEVERKWNVDQLREWVWDGKTYKHKGKDGNE